MTTLGRPGLIALVALFSLLWSSAFVAGKVAVLELSPILTLVLRFAISVAIMLPLCLIHASQLFDRRTVATGSLLGLLNNAVYLGFTFSALQFISPALVVVIVSCAPFITTIVAIMLRIDRFDVVKTLGIALGFIGVVVITGINVSRSDVVGMLLAFAGTIAFSVATVMFRGKTAGLPVLAMNFWQSLAGGVALVPVASLQGAAIAALSMPTILALLYLAVVATIGGMALWMILIRMSGATTAASYHLLNPVFGVLLSYAVLGTPIALSAFVGAAIIAAGLALTMRTPKKAGVPQA